jgi:hypothetical protein
MAKIVMTNCAAIGNGAAGIGGSADKLEIDGLYSRGNGGGDINLDSVNELIVRNSDLEGDLPKSASGEKPTRKYFSGWGPGKLGKKD